MVIKIEIKAGSEAYSKLVELAAKNRRSIPREAEVILLRALGYWDEELPPNDGLTGKPYESH